MPFKDIKYHAFNSIYAALAKELTSTVIVTPVLTTDNSLLDTPVEFKAVWDTGAVVTCVSMAVRDRLKLYPIETESGAFLSGIGGDVPVERTFVSIKLTGEFEIKHKLVYVVDFNDDADIIIGMDIITMGDFAVCNVGGQTSFSFVLPPFPERINLAVQAETANSQNNKPDAG